MSVAGWDRSRVELSNPEVVFNFAASGVTRRVAHAELVEGNAGVVAQLMANLDPRRTSMIVHAGSWSQYEIVDPSANIVETDTMSPRTVYGAAKAGAELLGSTMAEQVGVRFVTLRLFNVYGPREDPSRLIPYVVQRGAERNARQSDFWQPSEGLRLCRRCRRRL